MMMDQFPIISIYIFIPLLGAIVLAFLRPVHRRTSFIIVGGVLVSEIILTILLIAQTNPDISTYVFTEKYSWIPFFNIHYAVGIDRISLLFCLLAVIVFCIVFFTATYETEENFNLKNICLLVSFTGVIGTFTATDAFLFYVFWEMIIFPAYIVMRLRELIISERFSLSFLIYSVCGSFAMFAGLIFIAISYQYQGNGLSFSIIDWLQSPIPMMYPAAVFALMFTGFAIKTPLFPFHGWLSDTYCHSPSSVTVMMAGILSKLGIYGIIRFLIPLFSDVIMMYRTGLMTLAVAGIIYASLIALVSNSPKKILTYSSMAHLGMIILGLFSLNADAVNGSVFQLLNHGLIAGTLFMAWALVIHRSAGGDKEITGFWKILPVMSFFIIFMVFANTALPGTSSFVGEFKILAGTFAAHRVLAAVAAFSTILAAIYMLNLIRIYIMGQFGGTAENVPADLNYREITLLAVMSGTVLLLGFYPEIFTLFTGNGLREFIETYLPKIADPALNV